MNLDNKRGQGMSTNAIILIILGIVVLVVLILGFTMGWNKIAPWISSNNVDTIAVACESACATNGVYDYCMARKDLKADDGKLKDVTCNYLAKRKPAYAISLCPSISCENVLLVNVASEADLSNYCLEESEPSFVQALIGDALITYECPTN